MPIFSPDTLERATTLIEDRLGKRVGSMFRQCFRDTLASTIEVQPDGTAFVVTGDIPAMWQRDSTTQITPYLHFLHEDALLADTVSAISRRQLSNLCRDPYANAFNRDANGERHRSDLTDGSDWIWERKYEIDSLCFPIQLAHDFWAITGRTDHLAEFRAAAHVVIDTLRVEQDHEAVSRYRFDRPGGSPTDTLARGGQGGLVRPNGLTWSGFRPSDDACAFGYNIPGNAFAAVELGHIAEIAREVLSDEVLLARAEALATEIAGAVNRYGTVESDHHGTVYAYEIDGFGRALIMDDANMPSLLSLPLMGWCETDDPTYLATRALVLSDENPYFYRGRAASGVGSPHTPPNTVWPIALAVQGLTSRDVEEKGSILEVLVRTDAGTGFMHESFDKDDPATFTRPWFSWANAMFCELALDVAGMRTYTRGRSAPPTET